MGFPQNQAMQQQPTQVFPQQPQPFNPGPAPQFNPAGLRQQAQPTPATIEERLAALEASHKDVRNQVAELTGAVNGLGQNTEALHQWQVSTMEGIVSMIQSIVQQVQQEGVMKLLTGMFTGGGGQPPAQPQFTQPPQQ